MRTLGGQPLQTCLIERNSEVIHKEEEQAEFRCWTYQTQRVPVEQFYAQREKYRKRMPIDRIERSTLSLRKRRRTPKYE